jgi:excisionase family DNA binding protein
MSAPLYLEEDEDNRKTDPYGQSFKLPEVLSIEEVARLLRVHRKTVYEAVARGQLPGRRIGRVLRIDRDTLLAWLKRQSAVLDSKSQGRVASPGGRYGGTAR